MPKSNLFKGKTVTTLTEGLKNNIQYVLLVIIIINLLYLCIYINGKMDSLKQAQNRFESELLSLRSMVQKETLAAEESANIRYEALQKVYSLNLDQTKTISQIPTDNAFFKKWLVANHEENTKNLEAVNNKLTLIQADTKNLNNKIGLLKVNNSKATAVPARENVEAISL
ncbi:MAG: hypothetical protein WCR55_05725 [Lentisphaerota bacterium]